MSYENRGSMVSSIVIAQDGTGNFDCTGANDQVEIGAALTRANQTGADTLRFKAGIYDINNLTISNDVRVIADEEGVIWDLPASPSLTTATATVQFEGITFQSTLDGTGHFVIDGDMYFRFCNFDFQLDCEVELVPIISSNAGSANRIEFLNCTLIGGESGAEYFTFFEANADMNELIVKDFLISSLICDDETFGRFDIFSVPNTVDVELFWSENVEVKGLDYTYDGCTFLTVAIGGNVTRVIMDGFMLHDDGVWTNNNSSFCPILSFNSGAATATIGDCVISNWKLHGRAHPQIHGATYLEVTNLENISPAVIGGGHMNAFDCGTTDSYPCEASFNNVTTKDGSLTMNWGWRNFKVTNSTFINSRIAVLMEKADTADDERFVEVSNSYWHYDAGGKYSFAFQLGHAQNQGIYLSRLQVEGCMFDDLLNVFTTGTPQRPTHMVLDDVVLYPTIDSSNPRLFDGSGDRDNDNQVLWIFDSDIATDSNDSYRYWGGLRANDRLDSVRFNDNGTLSYSENDVLSGTFAIDGVALRTVTVNHLLAGTPAAQHVQATISEDTDVDDWWGFITKVKDIGAAQISVDIYVLNASATGGATAKVAVRGRLTS